MAVFRLDIIDGDLATVDADLIVQQCNCLTVRAHGLSQYLAETIGANPYKKRRSLQGNLAIKEDRSDVGTVRIYSRKKVRPHHLACFFAQFAPGKPGTYYQDVCKEHNIVDDHGHREEWFRECLLGLEKKIALLNVKVVAFPFRIGCGLAGGDWNIYKAMITEWAFRNKDNFRVIIVKK